LGSWPSVTPILSGNRCARELGDWDSEVLNQPC